MLSTDATKFFSSGENCSRVEKTDIVSTHPLSYEYLNVCLAAEINCSRCYKCQRTMVTLDLLGKLDLYNKVFDLNDYQTHRSKYFGLVLAGVKNDPMKREIYDAIKRENFHIPFGAYFYRYSQAIYRHCPWFIKRQYRKIK
jgi:predicted aldo/keto reductase-like oxidoreductase